MNECRKIVLWIVAVLGILQFGWLLTPAEEEEKSDKNEQTTPNATNLPLPVKRKSSKRTPVLFMAQYRSGSSFGASIFNKHKDVFYMYEPLIAVEGVLPNQQHYDLGIVGNL